MKGPADDLPIVLGWRCAQKAELTRRAQELVDNARGERLELGPDLIVGYARGTRGSNESALGEFPAAVLGDNTDSWSGDHCIDPKIVPGVLFCNRKIESEGPRLMDLGPTTLDLFGVDTPAFMDGKPLTVK